MARIYAGTAAVFIATLLGGLFYFVVIGKSGDPYAACRDGQIATGPGSIGGPFTLVNEDGKTVTDAEIITKPTLIYFGYTFCPDLCPVDNARNAEATDILARKGYDVTPVFISFDTKRDTADVLRQFTESISPKLIGLTGTADQVKAAAKEFRVYYHAPDTTQPGFLFDHSTFSYLMMPKTGFADFFKRDVTPEKMADRVACFVDAARHV